MRDLVIIGSGPAGLSAAVYAKRAKLDVVVIEKAGYSGGQIVSTEQVDNYLGLPETDGFTLGSKFREHADMLETEFIDAEVTKIEEITDTEGKKAYRIILNAGESVEAKTIIAATGASHRKLGAAGEEELTGTGVSYCATCDGAFFKKKVTAVVGGGDVALEDAIYLSALCEKVYLIHRRDEFRAAVNIQQKVKETPNIEILPFYEIKEIKGDNKVSSIKLVQNKTGEEKELEVSGVFVAVGMKPVTDIFKDYVELDKTGYIKAGEDCKTSSEGIFAAGDIRTKPLRQVVTAVADGATAVQSVERYLNGR